MATTTERASLRDRLYEAYASQHAGTSRDDAVALIYRRDIRPSLPPPGAGPVMDIGCGQGGLVRLMLQDGYDATGVDISPEQVAIARTAGLEQVRHGDYWNVLREGPGRLAALTATDVLEHLSKDEVLDTFDAVAVALIPGGVFIARVPNAVSPFGGHIRYGDFTHETWYTARSVRQLAAAAGFGTVRVHPCPPIAHGWKSMARVALFKSISSLYQLTLAAETGTFQGHIVTQNLTFVAHKAA